MAAIWWPLALCLLFDGRAVSLCFGGRCYSINACSMTAAWWPLLYGRNYMAAIIWPLALCPLFDGRAVSQCFGDRCCSITACSITSPLLFDNCVLDGRCLLAAIRWPLALCPLFTHDWAPRLSKRLILTSIIVKLDIFGTSRLAAPWSYHHLASQSCWPTQRWALFHRSALWFSDVERQCA